MKIQRKMALGGIFQMEGSRGILEEQGIEL